MRNVNTKYQFSQFKLHNCFAFDSNKIVNYIRFTHFEINLIQFLYLTSK